MYQNKPEDRVITPAHLMLIPLDSGSMTNFLNFKNIGVNTLQESTAFSKIRNSTKVYNSHLVHTPSTFTNKYYSLNSAFSNENDYLTTSSFGLRKQHNLSSASSYGNSFASTALDSQSFDKFLTTNLNVNTGSTSSSSQLAPSPLSLSREDHIASTPNTTRLSSLLSPNHSSSSSLTKLVAYPSLLSNINDNSDKAGLSYPITKLTSPNVVSGDFRNSEITSQQAQSTDSSSVTGNYNSLTRDNSSTSTKVFNLSGPNSKVLLGDQSIRAHGQLSPNKSNYNLSSGLNTLTSNAQLGARSGQQGNGFQNALAAESNYADYSLTNNLASSRSFLSESHPAVMSSLPSGSNSLNYDSTTAVTGSTSYTVNGELEESSRVSKSSVGDVFVGSREKTPRAVNTSY